MSDPNGVPSQRREPEAAPEPYGGAMPPPLPRGEAPGVAELPEIIAGAPEAPLPPPPEAHAPAARPPPVAPVQYTAPAFEMPSPRAETLDYQFPATKRAGSQWATDDQAYGGCMVYALLVLTGIGAVIGLIWWLISLFFTG